MTATQRFLEDNQEKRQVCEIWTRVMGYHRPISSFNPAKKQEHADRVLFKEASLTNIEV